MTNTTVSCVRGCGTRSAGGTYLALGIGPGGTLTVEDLILDPMKIWPGEWQRGFKILPDPRGWNNVGIFVGESFYASPWDFVEEARRFGISRKVTPTFPFEELTPGKSLMIFIHRRGYPKFSIWDTILNEKVEIPQHGCKMKWEEELWATAVPGWHPKVEKATFCTFSHRHFAGLIHDCKYDEDGHFEVEMPSFTYDGYIPMVKTNNEGGSRMKLEWSPAAFMAAPISHIEFPKKINQKSAQKANKAGYETIVTEW